MAVTYNDNLSSPNVYDIVDEGSELGSPSFIPVVTSDIHQARRSTKPRATTRGAPKTPKLTIAMQFLNRMETLALGLTKSPTDEHYIDPVPGMHNAIAELKPGQRSKVAALIREGEPYSTTARRITKTLYEHGIDPGFVNKFFYPQARKKRQPKKASTEETDERGVTEDVEDHPTSPDSEDARPGEAQHSACVNDVQSNSKPLALLPISDRDKAFSQLSSEDDKLSDDTMLFVQSAIQSALATREVAYLDPLHLRVDSGQQNPIVSRSKLEATYLVACLFHDVSQHWTLAVVDQGCRQVLFYDSVHDQDRVSRTQQWLERWADLTMPGQTKFQFLVMKGPQQQDSYNCGVFVLEAMFHWLRSQELPQSFNPREARNHLKTLIQNTRSPEPSSLKRKSNGFCQTRGNDEYRGIPADARPAKKTCVKANDKGDQEPNTNGIVAADNEADNRGAIMDEMSRKILAMKTMRATLQSMPEPAHTLEWHERQVQSWKETLADLSNNKTLAEAKLVDANGSLARAKDDLSWSKACQKFFSQALPPSVFERMEEGQQTPESPISGAIGSDPLSREILGTMERLEGQIDRLEKRTENCEMQVVEALSVIEKLTVSLNSILGKMEEARHMLAREQNMVQLFHAWTTVSGKVDEMQAILGKLH